MTHPPCSRAVFRCPLTHSLAGVVAMDLLAGMAMAQQTQIPESQINREPPHEVEGIVNHPHPLRIMFGHADHILFGLNADVKSVYYRLDFFPPEVLENPAMPNILAFVRPQWLAASRSGDTADFARRLWRDHHGAPYMLVASGNAFRHLNAPPVGLHHDFPYLLFLVDAPKTELEDFYRIGELVELAQERYHAPPPSVFAPVVISWGTTYLGDIQSVIRHPEFQADLELTARLTPAFVPKTDRDIERRANGHLFSREQLFGEAPPEDILEAMAIFTEYVARERTLHGLDDLVRQHPDNLALWFIGRDLDQQDLRDYPVLTHLPRPPRPPTEILKENLQALETMLETFEAKAGEAAPSPPED